MYDYLLQSARQQAAAAATVPGRNGPYSARSSNTHKGVSISDARPTISMQYTERVDPFCVWVSASPWLGEGQLEGLLRDKLASYGQINDISTRRGERFTSGIVKFRSSEAVRSILADGPLNLYYKDACINLKAYRPRVYIDDLPRTESAPASVISPTARTAEREYRPVAHRPFILMPQPQAIQSLLNQEKTPKGSGDYASNPRSYFKATIDSYKPYQYPHFESNSAFAVANNYQNPLKRKPQTDECALQIAGQKRIRAEVERTRMESRSYSDEIPETQANSPPSFSRSRSSSNNRSSSPEDDLLKTPPLSLYSDRRSRTPEGRDAFVSVDEKHILEEPYVKVGDSGKSAIDPVLLSRKTSNNAARNAVDKRVAQKTLNASSTKTPSTATNSYYSTQDMSHSKSEDGDDFFTPDRFQLKEQPAVGDLLEAVAVRLQDWLEAKSVQLWSWEEKEDLEEGEFEEIELQ